MSSPSSSIRLTVSPVALPRRSRNGYAVARTRSVASTTCPNSSMRPESEYARVVGCWRIYPSAFSVCVIRCTALRSSSASSASSVNATGRAAALSASRTLKHLAMEPTNSGLSATARRTAAFRAGMRRPRAPGRASAGVDDRVIQFRTAIAPPREALARGSRVVELDFGDEQLRSFAACLSQDAAVRPDDHAAAQMMPRPFDTDAVAGKHERAIFVRTRAQWYFPDRRAVNRIGVGRKADGHDDELCAA